MSKSPKVQRVSKPSHNHIFIHSLPDFITLSYSLYCLHLPIYLYFLLLTFSIDIFWTFGQVNKNKQRRYQNFTFSTEKWLWGGFEMLWTFGLLDRGPGWRKCDRCGSFTFNTEKWLWGGFEILWTFGLQHWKMIVSSLRDVTWCLSVGDWQGLVRRAVRWSQKSRVRITHGTVHYAYCLR